MSAGMYYIRLFLVVVICFLACHHVPAKVDVKDIETLQLFKGYCQMVSDQKHLLERDISNAHGVFEKSELKLEKKDSENKYDDIVRIDINDSEDEDDGLISSVKQNSTRLKKTTRRFKSKKFQFIDWGSRNLIVFLQSIGKTTERTFSLQEVSDIVKRYIRENNLLNPHKKRRVLCDSRLHALFGRKSISRVKINDLLASHFAANESQEDDIDFSSEDENYEKPQGLQSDLKCGKSLSRRDKARVSPYACISVKNIRAVYLMRSLIQELLLRSPDTVDSILTGCFVRIKSRAKAALGNSHMLVQITGTKQVSEDYKYGDSQTNIILLVSNQQSDVYIHMVSDDDFTEEECRELGRLMQEGHLKRPKVEELEKKALDLHKDITNHRIKRDIILLQNLIKRANEKGWRREYADKLEVLLKSDEQDRLRQDLPNIVADVENEISYAATEPGDSIATCVGAENARTVVEKLKTCNSESINIHNTSLDGTKKESGINNLIVIIDSPERDARELKVSFVAPENEAQISMCEAESTVQRQFFDCKGISTNNANTSLKDASNPGDNHKAKENLNDEHKSPSWEECCREDVLRWMYMDPSGVIQGPFSLEELRDWYEDGYFPDDFEIWESNQSQLKSVLLVVALRKESAKPE